MRIIGQHVDVGLDDPAEAGASVRCTLGGRIPYPPVAGDRVRVLLSSAASGDANRSRGLVEAVGPRRTILVRAETDGSDRARPVVANADLLLVVAAAARPPLRPALIDRALAAAWAGGLDAGLVVTKTDLDADGDGARAAALYAGLGHPVAAVDLKRGGAGAVLELVRGRTTVFAGHSGVGKSTLANALTGEELLTGAVNRQTGRGRQTTVAARMLPLLDPGGGRVVDTPGIRTFGVAGVAPGDLERGFVEIAAAAGRCAFADCLHRPGEGGCALEAAVAAGQVASSRLASYREILGALLAAAPS